MWESPESLWRRLKLGREEFHDVWARIERHAGQDTADVLAYFDRPGTSNGPTEALNGRLG